MHSSSNLLACEIQKLFRRALGIVVPVAVTTSIGFSSTFSSPVAFSFAVDCRFIDASTFPFPFIALLFFAEDCGLLGFFRCSPSGRLFVGTDSDGADISAGAFSAGEGVFDDCAPWILAGTGFGVGGCFPKLDILGLGTACFTGLFLMGFGVGCLVGLSVTNVNIVCFAGIFVPGLEYGLFAVGLCVATCAPEIFVGLFGTLMGRGEGRCVLLEIIIISSTAVPLSIVTFSGLAEILQRLSSTMKHS
mmetsp:Transcript_23209/g.50137  ORF Transcript_23209/g.50137 Transcript_23209/m.50137 type:complete len:247 (+) Transcript_23209:167-907(+)